MARIKPQPSKTIGPIHFEDLEPHRFEDLVRQLAYDFRDWQSIEATGRGGGDDGFDIRAIERVTLNVDDGEVARDHPIDGNLWMIQCKRQKRIAPSQVKSILQDISSENPPYGYILAAPADFTKKSYDVFRDELRQKGVREFVIWGKAALEDMLFQPRNDRVLFAFFGLSLITRRRSKTAELRSAISMKNRLYDKLGGPNSELYIEVLLRDINAEDYPFEASYPDFENHPRWKKRVVSGHHPQGLRVHTGRFRAFVDRKAKEWDYTSLSNSADRPDDHQEHMVWAARDELVGQMLIGEPRSRIGTFSVHGLLPYKDILLFDPLGDSLFDIPHIFTDYPASGSIYSGYFERIDVQQEYVEIDESWQRIDYFEKRVPLKKIPSEKPSADPLCFSADVLDSIRRHKDGYDTLYFPKNTSLNIRVGAVFELKDKGSASDKRYVRVTYCELVPFGEYVQSQKNAWAARKAAEAQLGRMPEDDECQFVVEISGAYPREWE